MVTHRKKTIIAGQLSTVHSSDEALQPDKVEQHLEKINRLVPLDILIIGWNERRALFDRLTHPGTRKSEEVYLWYPFLSDYPGMESKHLVVNVDGESSRGWAGYAGTHINESFQQACPNNPDAVSTSLLHLERFMSEYNFDGAFIDKIRFPSPANGFDEVFSCFCDHCISKAAQFDLDLSEVRYLLQHARNSAKSKTLPLTSHDQIWLEGLVAEHPSIEQFIKFRKNSINRLLLEIESLLKRQNKKLALDVFSPSLAPLVGQDFGFMATIAEWIKPMIYRFGHGPSSLRSEIPALIYGLQESLGFELDEIMQYMGGYIKGLESKTVDEIEKIAPLDLIRTETDLAVEQLSGTQVYLGLETVFIPNKMEIKPEDIIEILDIGSTSGVNGYVLSWDLLHTPINNLDPLRALL